jgi:hypothetical protein
MTKRSEMNMPFKWPYPDFERQDEYEITLNGVALFKGASHHVARLLVNMYARSTEGKENGSST